MERNKTTGSLIVFILFFLLQGCSTVQNPEAANVHPDLAELLQSDAVARRFQESAAQNQSAVDSAIELSEKYARLSDEAAVLRQQNENLITHNQQLNDKVRTFGTQLQQTQKELAEANEILIEMRVELNDWKSDVIGFRDEMRNAETAQLEALLKILQVLGGEPKTELAQGQAAGSTVASLGQ